MAQYQQDIYNQFKHFEQNQDSFEQQEETQPQLSYQEKILQRIKQGMQKNQLQNIQRPSSAVQRNNTLQYQHQEGYTNDDNFNEEDEDEDEEEYEEEEGKQQNYQDFESNQQENLHLYEQQYEQQQEQEQEDEEEDEEEDDEECDQQGQQLQNNFNGEFQQNQLDADMMMYQNELLNQEQNMQPEQDQYQQHQQQCQKDMVQQYEQQLMEYQAKPLGNNNKMRNLEQQFSSLQLQNYPTKFQQEPIMPQNQKQRIDTFQQELADSEEEEYESGLYDQKENFNMKPKMKHMPSPKKLKKQQIQSQPQSTKITKKQPITINTIRPVTSSGYGQQKSVKKQPFMQQEKEKQVNPFKPVYTIPMNEFKIHCKQFDYKSGKKFSTIAKKSDPVSRWQNMSQGWKKSKFLINNNRTNNNNTGTQGRKLQLSERIAKDKPEYVFHKYLNKDQTQLMF